MLIESPPSGVMRGEGAYLGLIRSAPYITRRGQRVCLCVCSYTSIMHNTCDDCILYVRGVSLGANKFW